MSGEKELSVMQLLFVVIVSKGCSCHALFVIDGSKSICHEQTGFVRSADRPEPFRRGVGWKQRSGNELQMIVLLEDLNTTERSIRYTELGDMMIACGSPFDADSNHDRC
ncbi:hypothetical protein ASB62_05120 [Chlorobium limicola]|uniref:Uncharacterized protein n=1 Tax=Chlorobium limicola TaxID=1092 RepID=A0A101JN53_CHLLI|nr:hypothetical protein ASB62_05120 [Chlorobium limicola]